MQPSESPFPCKWWGTSLENVGLGEVRPDVGTYGCYEYDLLPLLPFEMHGDFIWLTTATVHDEHNIGDPTKADENTLSFKSLHTSSAQLGVPLPESFVKFMENPSLHQRIRSNTDCFLDVCPALIRSPKGNGYLIRFLADSQGCIFWYIYLTHNGADHAVVSSSNFYGTELEQWQDEEQNLDEIVFSAESFEAFMYRFWLENEIWFAEWKGTPIPDLGQQYIEQYRLKQQQISIQQQNSR